MVLPHGSTTWFRAKVTEFGNGGFREWGFTVKSLGFKTCGFGSFGTHIHSMAS